MKFPVANKKLHIHEKHNDQREDPYFWMHQRDNEEVLSHLKSENDFLTEVMKPTETLQAQIFTEIKGRLKEDDSTYPYTINGYDYWSEFVKDKEYPFYWRKNLQTQKSEIYFDVNQMAEGKAFYDIGGLKVSPDQKILAFFSDEVGRRKYHLQFKNLQTQEVYSHKIENTAGSGAWGNDNKHFFYVTKNPESLRNDTVWRLNIETGSLEKMYFESDDTFAIYLSKSLDKNHICIIAAQTVSTEYHLLDANHPLQAPKIFLPREREHRYQLMFDEKDIYILSDKGALNFRLLKTPLNQWDVSSWQEVIPHRMQTFLEEVEVFKNFIVILEKEEGLRKIRILNAQKNKSDFIKFPESCYSVSLQSNVDFQSQKIRYSYTSLSTPATLYDYDVIMQKSILLKQKEVPSFNPEKYLCERVWFTARDGVKVPISLLRQKNHKLGDNPLYIYAYGSYGLGMESTFDNDVISLIDRGFVHAIIHTRGGDDMGRNWYEDGKLFKKKNTFNDFIDGTLALVEKGYGNANKVVAQGGSAGGLLMGAIMNMRPDLYRGIHAAVPFVDVITTMLDDSIPLTTFEYDEWGNPNNKDYYEYMKSYSPYDNVAFQKYPHLLVTTGYHDSQVQYWEPMKWVAKLRDHNQASTQILFKTDMEAGHGGTTGRFKRLKETALEYAFFIQVVNDKLDEW